MQKVLTQPQPLWDLELDVFTNEIERPYRNGDIVWIHIEVKNCSQFGIVCDPEVWLTGQMAISYKGLEYAQHWIWWNDPNLVDLEDIYVHGPLKDLDRLAVGFHGELSPRSETSMVNAYSETGELLEDYTLKSVITLPFRITDLANAWLHAEIYQTGLGDSLGVLRGSPNYVGEFCVEYEDWLWEDCDSTPNNSVYPSIMANPDPEFRDSWWSISPGDEDDSDAIVFTNLSDNRKPLECECEEIVSAEEEMVTANPEVVGESAENSSAGSVGVPSASPTGGNPAPPIPGPTGTSSGGTIGATGGCMIAADVPSTFPANPVDPNGIFDFDYYIESVARFGQLDAAGRPIRSSQTEYKVNYYVNTNDGSMFFKEEFFAANFMLMSTRLGRIDGVLIKSDGQQVLYGLDRYTSALRAVVVDQTATTDSLTTKKRFNVEEFISSIGSIAAAPEPLPAHLSARWGNMPGYVGQMNDIDNTKSTVTIYMGTSPDIDPIPTNKPLIGWLSGIFKDHIRENCNKLAVYTLMKNVRNEFMEVELTNIQPMDFSYQAQPNFDGSPYKVATLGGTADSDYKMSMEDLERQAMIFEGQLDVLNDQRSNCPLRDTACYNALDRQIAAKKREIEDLKCQAACLSGLEQYMNGCICN